MKILVIGPSWVGDMVMSQSLYSELKKQHPDATIDVLAPAWCGPILERMPEINQAIDMPIGHGAFQLAQRWSIGRHLADNHYTHAFILPNSAKSALIPFFAGIPHRIGWKGEFRYGLLNDLRPDKRVFQYMVERYVALAATKTNMVQATSLTNVIKPKLTIDTKAQHAARERLALRSDKTVIGLCPGAEFGPAKRWPDHYYAEVAAHCIDQGKQIWLFGSKKDRDVTQKIRNALTPDQQAHCYDLAGETTLIEAVDLLACCQTVISNDSGLMHVSAAVGCNIIAIYGSSSPKYTPPLTDNVISLNTDIDCRPCFKRECPLGHMNCLNHLMPDVVVKALDRINQA